MIEFGYKIHADRQIDYDSGNQRILKFIKENEPSIDWCMSCGTCSSSCTASVSSTYSLRRLILLARRGMEDEILNSVYRCRFCGKCINACPRGVNTRNIVYQMQLAATKIMNHEI